MHWTILESSLVSRNQKKSLRMDKWTDEWMDRLSDRPMDGPTDRPTDRPIGKQTDRQTHGLTKPHIEWLFLNKTSMHEIKWLIETNK